MTASPTDEELKKIITRQETEIRRLRQKIEKMKDQEEKAKTLIENANDVFAYIDKDNRVMDVNSRVEDVFGYKRREVVGVNIYDIGIIHPEDKMKSADYFENIFAGNQSKMLRIQALRKDKTPVAIEFSSSPIRLKGQIQGVLVIIRDVTERIQAEEELQLSEEKSKTIFETANDLIIHIGVDGTILDVNDKVTATFGYSREEIIGKKHTDTHALNKKNLNKIHTFYADIISGKPSQMLEIDALRKDRRKVFLELTCKAIRKNGQLKGFLNVIRDITERKQAEEALRVHRDHLEELVKERTANIEEANTALKVLLKKREEDRAELEEKMLFNVKELILPYVEKMKKSRLDDKTKTYINIIESHLNEITSPFARKLSSKYLNFTSGEIQVANLIKHGMGTKEIAKTLNLSHRTIEFHRGNIRRKIGIKKSKATLRSYLLSIQ